MIILHIIFVIGIILSVKYNNKNTLKLAIILLLYSVLVGHNKEHYKLCDDKSPEGLCKIDMPEGPSLLCEKSGKNNNHCRNAIDIFKPDGSSALCIHSFDKVESLKDKDLRSCDNVGALLYTKDGDYIVLKSPDTDPDALHPHGDHYGVGLDGSPMNYDNKNKSSLSSNKKIQLTEITKLRLFKKYQLDTWSGTNFSGKKTSYPNFDKLYDDFVKTSITNNKLYDEYNIEEGSIKSLRLSPINKKKILEFKGITYGNEHELKRQVGDDKITLNRDACIKKFSETNEYQFAVVNNKYTVETDTDITGDKNTLNPNINFCKFSKANFDDISGIETLIGSDNKSIIQQNPSNYNILYDQSYKEQNSQDITNIIELPDTTNKIYSVSECAKLCDNTVTEQGPCIGFQYSSEYIDKDDDGWKDKIGKCVLLNNNYKADMKYKNPNYNIYLRDFTNVNGVCKNSAIANRMNESKEIIDNKVEFSNYLSIDAIENKYEEVTNEKSRLQEKICHDNLLKIYENPDNLIIIDNINLDGNIIKFKFTNSINIANINIDGTATVLEDGKSKVKNIDWADTLNPHIKVSDHSNTSTFNEFESDRDNIVQNCYDNNICTYLHLKSIENDEGDIEQDDDEDEIDKNQITLPKNAAYLEFTFKNNDTSKLINVKIRKIIIYIYNNSYVNTCNTGQKLQNNYSPDSYLPMQIDIFTGQQKSLRAQITKESMLKDAVIVDLLPKLPYDTISYNKINDFGDETLGRKWVNITGKANDYAFCRFIEDENNTNMVRLKCTDTNDKVIQLLKPIKKSIAKNVFFTQTSSKNIVENMCYCTTLNNKTYIKCIETGIDANEKSHILDINIDKSCAELTKQIKSDPSFIKKLLIQNKLEYCGDIKDEEHKPFINNLKYKIDAGFYIDGTRNAINGMILFKNTEMNGYPVVLYKIGTGTPNIVCHTTFPGLSFNTNQLDRIDAAMIIPNELTNEKIAYFFRSTDSKREVIKYNLTKKQIVCNPKSLIIYPRNVEDEFMISKANVNFFKNPIIGAAYIGNNRCYLFTKNEFIEYNLNDGKTINLTNIQKTSRNKKWPKMSFSKLDTVISGINNKSLIFVSKNRFTEILLDNKNTIKHLNKFISENKELRWNKLWDIRIEKLIEKISKYKVKPNKSCTIAKSKQDQVIENINKKNDIENDIENQKYKIQIEKEENLKQLENNQNIIRNNNQKIKDLNIISTNLENEINKYQELLKTNPNNQELIKLIEDRKNKHNKIKSNLKNIIDDTKKTQQNINKIYQNQNNFNNLNNNKANKCTGLDGEQVFNKIIETGYDYKPSKSNDGTWTLQYDNFNQPLK